MLVAPFPRPEDPPYCFSCLEDPDPRGGSACDACRKKADEIANLRKRGHILWARRHHALVRALDPRAQLWHAYDMLDVDDRSEAWNFPDGDAFCYWQSGGLDRHQWTRDGATLPVADVCPTCASLARLPASSSKVPIDAIDDESRLIERDHHHFPESNPDASVDYRAVAAIVLDPGRRVPGWEAPRVLPPLWHEPILPPRGPDGTTKYKCEAHRLTAILSCTIQNDGRAWLHLSVSHEKRIPNWTELVLAKEALLGNREAYKVIPPRERYVNINERVLHMFALLDEKATALPDFTHGTGCL